MSTDWRQKFNAEIRSTSGEAQRRNREKQMRLRHNRQSIAQRVANIMRERERLVELGLGGVH